MKSLILVWLFFFAFLFIGCKEESVVNNYTYGSSSLDSLWQKTNGPYQIQFWSLYTTNNNNIYAYELTGSSKGRMFYSSDNGNSWSVMIVDTNFYFGDIKDGKNGSLFILNNEKGLYKSIDDGKKWIRIRNSLIEPGNKKDFHYSTFAVAKNGDVILGIAWEDDKDSLGGRDKAEFYRSSDDGTNWSLVKNGNDSLKKVFNIQRGKNGNLYVFQWIHDGSTASYLLFSSDNGYTWTKSSDEIHDCWDDFITNSTGSIFYKGYYGGIRRSDDNGATSSLKIDGLYGFINSFNVGNNDHLFCGTSNGLYRSIDNGDSWQPLLENIGDITSVINTNSRYVYFVKDHSVIYRSKKANFF